MKWMPMDKGASRESLRKYDAQELYSCKRYGNAIDLFMMV